MTTVETALNLLPDTSRAVIILSGGMDSTIAMRIAVEKYGSDNVKALSFDYRQKQRLELGKAQASTATLGVEHKILDLGILGELSKGISANVDTDIAVPTIREVLGDPAPKTEVPYRNMLLLTLAAAYAQGQNCQTIICGIQVHDLYSYWDCSADFINHMNKTIQLNRKFKPTIIAPFAQLSKTQELKILRELDGNFNLLAHTLTCYNPNSNGFSCGRCPSCAERKKAFKNIGVEDPIRYQVR